MVYRPHPPDHVAARTADDVAALRSRFGASVLAARSGPGEPVLVVARETIVALARELLDGLGYQLLRSVTAVDFPDTEPRFQVVYHFSALTAAMLEGSAEARSDDPLRLLRIKVPVAADDAVVPSLTDVYPTANWHEREVFDMFGIEFAGHPDLRRILMPESFGGHPLRKDFPLQYEDVAFTHNRDEIARAKPRATS